jgi:hypothetical protein
MNLNENLKLMTIKRYISLSKVSSFYLILY